MNLNAKELTRQEQMDLTLSYGLLMTEDLETTSAS